jgi:hypothetical protein
MTVKQKVNLLNQVLKIRMSNIETNSNDQNINVLNKKLSASQEMVLRCFEF